MRRSSLNLQEFQEVRVGSRAKSQGVEAVDMAVRKPNAPFATLGALWVQVESYDLVARADRGGFHVAEWHKREVQRDEREDIGSQEVGAKIGPRRALGRSIDKGLDCLTGCRLDRFVAAELPRMCDAGTVDQRVPVERRELLGRMLIEWHAKFARNASEHAGPVGSLAESTLM